MGRVTIRPVADPKRDIVSYVVPGSEQEIMAFAAKFVADTVDTECVVEQADGSKQTMSREETMAWVYLLLP